MENRIIDLTTNESQIVVNISCILDDVFTTITLNTVNDTSVSLSSTLTTHPIVSGDLVADHIFTNPATLSLSGSFQSKSSVSDFASISEIQSLFNKIKKDGSLCTISKSNPSNSDDISFVEQKNMVLTSIQWTEGINSAKFRFEFNQVLLASVTSGLETDVVDEFLPDVTLPKTLNFTESLIDEEQITALVYKYCKETGIITEEFDSYIRSFTSGALLGAVITTVEAVIIGKIAVAAGASLYIPGGIAVVAIGAIGWGIIRMIQKIQQSSQYKVKQFKYFKDDNKMRQEVERFNNFTSQIFQNISLLNDKIKVYQVSSNEPQECLITISNNYYDFIFTKNNVSDSWDLNVVTLQEKSEKAISLSSAKTDYSQLDKNNYLFRAAETGEYVYLLRHSEDEKDLRNYYILVSSILPTEFNSTIEQLIKDALIY